MSRARVAIIATSIVGLDVLATTDLTLRPHIRSRRRLVRRFGDNVTSQVYLTFMTQFKNCPPRSILVIATRQIGDVLLTTPLIKRVRVLWPEAQIDVLGFAETLGMLVGNPDIRRLLGAPSSGGTIAMLRYVRSEALWRLYDLALVTQQNDRAHLVGFLTAEVRSGIVSRDLKTSWWKRALLAHQVVLAGDLGSVHTVDEKLALLDPWVEPGSNYSHSDVICVPGTQLPADLELSLRGPLVVLHVPSMWKYKQWPLEHFTVLARSLVAAGAQIVITGGSSEGDRQKTAQVTRDVGAEAHSLINACGKLSFSQLTGLLRRSSLYVGPDTSITHLAAAVGVETIALLAQPIRSDGVPEDRGSRLIPGCTSAPSSNAATSLCFRGPDVAFHAAVPDVRIIVRAIAYVLRHSNPISSSPLRSVSSTNNKSQGILTINAPESDRPSDTGGMSVETRNFGIAVNGCQNHTPRL